MFDFEAPIPTNATVELWVTNDGDGSLESVRRFTDKPKTMAEALEMTKGLLLPGQAGRIALLFSVVGE